MDANPAEVDNNQLILASVFAWLRGQDLSTNSGGEGDNGNFISYFDELDELGEEIDAQGELTPANDGMFQRMRKVFQYEASKELLKQYNSILDHLREMETKVVEEEMTISDLESLSKTDTFTSVSTWFLDTSLSPSETEPSRTDSEVYKISSTESINEDHKHTIQDDCLYCIKATSGTPLSPDTTEDKNNSDNVVSADDELTQQNDNFELPDENNSYNPLQNNLLLQACILDINDRPMTVFVSQVANQMVPHLFNSREVAIVRHFVRYKIRITIEEINNRIIELNLQQQNIVSSIHNSDYSSDNTSSEEENNVTSPLSSSWHSSSPTSPSSSSSPFSIQEETIPEETSDENYSQEFTPSSPEQNDLHQDSSRTQAKALTSLSVQQNKMNHNLAQACESNAVLINEEHWERDGRTTEVLTVMKEMIGLSFNERHELLRQRSHSLDEEEYNAVLDFIESANDSKYTKKGFCQNLLKPFNFWYNRRKKSGEMKKIARRRWLQRLFC